MRSLKINRYTLSKFLLMLLAIFLILDGNSMYHSLADRNLHFPWICLSLALLVILFTGVKWFNRKMLTIAIGLFTYCGTYFLLNINTTNKEVYICILFGLPLFMTLFYNLRSVRMEYQLFYYIEGVMLFLSLVSLFFWFFGQMLGIIQTNMSVVSNWGQIRSREGYYGLHFVTSYSNSFAKGFPINSGLFTEGPMFCLWLCIALATELFLREKQSNTRTILLILTTLTTLSTTGAFFISFSVGIKYLEYMRGHTTLRKIIITILVMLLLPTLATRLQELLSLKMDTTSYSIRFQDYIAGYLIWREHPILGSGYGNITSLQKYVLLSKAGNVGFSNTITAVLGTGGIWNFIIYLASIFLPLFGKRKQNGNIKVFFVLYGFLTIFLIFFARVLIVVFFAFSFSQLKNLSQDAETERVLIGETKKNPKF